MLLDSAYRFMCANSSHIPEVSGLQDEYVCANTFLETNAAVSSSDDSDVVFMMREELEGEEYMCSAESP